MRVNVYAEELREITDEHGPRVTLIHKQVVPSFKHSAIQILLGDRVIHTERGKVKDDDTPGITFWFADEYQRGHRHWRGWERGIILLRAFVTLTLKRR